MNPGSGIVFNGNDDPWDKAQTHESLKASCIEEAEELIQKARERKGL